MDLRKTGDFKVVENLEQINQTLKKADQDRRNQRGDDALGSAGGSLFGGFVMFLAVLFVAYACAV